MYIIVITVYMKFSHLPHDLEIPWPDLLKLVEELVAINGSQDFLRVVRYVTTTVLESEFVNEARNEVNSPYSNDGSDNDSISEDEDLVESSEDDFSHHSSSKSSTRANLMTTPTHLPVREYE